MIDIERVIVLAWYRNIMNRLFTTDEDTKEIERQNTQQVEANNTGNINQKSVAAFRFPIISDAEIYGWDDTENQKSDNSSIKNDTEHHFQNYEDLSNEENDNWLKQTKVRNVYRASDNESFSKFSTAEKYKQATSNDLHANRTEKKSNSSHFVKPFTLTDVPSPVYGFEHNRKKQETSASITLDELDTQQLDIPSEQNDHEVTGKSSVARSEDSQVERDVTSLETVVAIDSVKAVDEKVDNPSSEVVNEDETHREIDAAQDEIQEFEPPQVVEVNEVERRERIVPFNVLMLKSDKAIEKIVQPPLSTERVIETGVTITENKQHHQSNDLTKKEIEVNEIVENGTEKSVGEPQYAFPPLSYLIPPAEQIEDVEWLHSQSEKLEESLSYFSIQANVIDAVQGPTVTRFELTVGHGTKVSKVRNLTDDLKLALAAEDIRIQAPIPGKSSIGIEIPNRKTRPVRISEVIATTQFQHSESPMEAVLGLDLTGVPVTIDLRKMPHGMIAGATGSGKSVCINSILASLLYKSSPTDLKMMLIDPKMVELAPFNGIPHLISPVITDVKAATAALKWAVAEMERRYELLAHSGVRDIERYNKLVMDNRNYSLKMPYLLIVIDELADLMMMAPADVEVSISRIAQKARACGMHLIIATQRPSVDVITGTIKANIPTRIAFSVSSQIDSRTIIDAPGAERLLGKGDMLYIGNGQSTGVRLQGTFVTDEEIERIIEHVQKEAEPNYLFGQDELLANAIEDEETDPLFDDACRFILEQGSASTSLLQRNFSIGYNRAAKLIDKLEGYGFISGQKGSKARDVFLTAADLEAMQNRTD